MSSPKNWDIEVDEAVFKTLKKTPRHDTEHILEIIRLLPMDPYFGDIKKIKGELDTWRRRVGSFRLFYKIKQAENIILVFHLERRTTNTY